MNAIWLVTNSGSGSYDPDRVEAVRSAFAERGYPVSRTVTVPDDELPDADGATNHDVDLIAIFTGDGTINALVGKLEGWSGKLLPLPGGTMNLLCRKLHGDADAETIIARAIDQGFRTRELPQAEGCGWRSLVGIIAGPTAAWGEVREDLRHADLKALAQSVPQAVDATFHGHQVSVRGCEGAFQAIFIDPQSDGLNATGVQVANLQDLAAHGFAWLNREFLGGPTRQLCKSPELEVCGNGTISLLIDGERVKGDTPCHFAWRSCPVAFVATDQGESP